MCTLILASQAFADCPLILATNRDEALDRPAQAPTLRTAGTRRILAPKDLVANGTWLGLNDGGLVVAITNRFGVPVDLARPSRGDLVMTALAEPSAHAAFKRLREINAAHYNGFHLLMADVDRTFIVWGDGEQLTSIELDPGLHVITERSFDAAPTQRESLIRELLPMPQGPAPTRQALQEILTTRAEPTTEGVLVDWPEHNYGTRSSTILYLGHKVQLHHANGRPDTTPFQDYSPAAKALIMNDK